MRKTVVAVFVMLFAGLAVFAQETASDPTAIDEVYLARDDGKGKAGEEAGDFLTTDIPIYCVVVLGTADVVTVKMNFVAVKVPGVKAETKVVTTSYTTKNGQNRVNFTGKPYDVWVPGKYRVDIFVNGKIARGLEFMIRAPIDRDLAGKPPKPPTVPTEPIKATRKPE